MFSIYVKSVQHTQVSQNPDKSGVRTSYDRIHGPGYGCSLNRVSRHDNTYAALEAPRVATLGI